MNDSQALYPDSSNVITISSSPESNSPSNSNNPSHKNTPTQSHTQSHTDNHSPSHRSTHSNKWRVRTGTGAGKFFWMCGGSHMRRRGSDSDSDMKSDTVMDPSTPRPTQDPAYQTTKNMYTNMNTDTNNTGTSTTAIGGGAAVSNVEVEGRESGSHIVCVRNDSNSSISESALKETEVIEALIATEVALDTTAHNLTNSLASVAASAAITVVNISNPMDHTDSPTSEVADAITTATTSNRNYDENDNQAVIVIETDCHPEPDPHMQELRVQSMRVRANSKPASDAELKEAMNQLLLLTETGNASSIRFILELYVDLRSRLNDFFDCQLLGQNRRLTPLMLAAASGHPHILRIFCNSYAVKPNIRSDDRYQSTALHIAVATEQLACIETLCTDCEGVDVNIQDSCQSTALHVAVRQRSLHAMQLLLHRADVDCAIQDNTGNTVLHLAASDLNYEAMQAIIAHCARKDIAKAAAAEEAGAGAAVVDADMPTRARDRTNSLRSSGRSITSISGRTSRYRSRSSLSLSIERIKTTMPEQTTLQSLSEIRNHAGLTAKMILKLHVQNKSLHSIPVTAANNTNNNCTNNNGVHNRNSNDAVSGDRNNAATSIRSDTIQGETPKAQFASFSTSQKVDLAGRCLALLKRELSICHFPDCSLYIYDPDNKDGDDDDTGDSDER